MKDISRDSLGRDTWMVFKIMGEFVEGFEKLSHVEPAVSIFGSARFQPDHPYFRKATEIARRLSDEGFSIITGGGPGIMEAANRGAKVGKSQSIGLNIKLPFEQKGNEFTDIEIDFDYNFFFLTTPYPDIESIVDKLTDCFIQIIVSNDGEEEPLRWCRVQRVYFFFHAKLE